MSYTPTEWKKGNIVSSAKLNKMEEGITNAGGGPLVVTLAPNGMILTTDKTAGEIFDALPNVAFVNSVEGNPIRTVFHISDYGQDRGVYYISLFTGQNSSSTLKEASLYASSATVHMTNQEPHD